MQWKNGSGESVKVRREEVGETDELATKMQKQVNSADEGQGRKRLKR